MPSTAPIRPPHASLQDVPRPRPVFVLSRGSPGGAATKLQQQTPSIVLARPAADTDTTPRVPLARVHSLSLSSGGRDAATAQSVGSSQPASSLVRAGSSGSGGGGGPGGDQRSVGDSSVESGAGARGPGVALAGLVPRQRKAIVMSAPRSAAGPSPPGDSLSMFSNPMMTTRTEQREQSIPAAMLPPILRPPAAAATGVGGAASGEPPASRRSVHPLARTALVLAQPTRLPAPSAVGASPGVIVPEDEEDDAAPAGQAAAPRRTAWATPQHL